MNTEAGKRLLGDNSIRISGIAPHPHGDWVRDCWLCAAIAAIEAESVAAERARIEEAVGRLGIAAGMPWPARCVEGDLVTEDPDAYETEDDEMLPDDRRCLTGGSHRWADLFEAVLAIVNPEEADHA